MPSPLESLMAKHGLKQETFHVLQQPLVFSTFFNKIWFDFLPWYVKFTKNPCIYSILLALQFAGYDQADARKSGFKCHTATTGSLLRTNTFRDPATQTSPVSEAPAFRSPGSRESEPKTSAQARWWMTVISHMFSLLSNYNLMSSLLSNSNQMSSQLNNHLILP